MTKSERKQLAAVEQYALNQYDAGEIVALDAMQLIEAECTKLGLDPGESPIWNALVEEV